MTPYLFGILKMDRPAWIKYLLAKGIPWVTYEISELVSGTSLDLVDSIKRPLIDFHILGNSIQDGTPSPETPLPIHSVGDNVNLFDKSTASNVFINSSGTLYVNSSGRKGFIMACEPNTTYTINKSIVTNALRLGYSENLLTDGDRVSGFLSSDNTSTATITTGSNSHYLYCYFKSNTDTEAQETTILNNCKVEKGTQATSYSPYNMGVATIVKTNSDNTQSTTYPIYTQSPFRSIGEVRDDFIKQAGVWYERHKIGHIASYNGETITTAYMSTTGELSTGAKVIYVLAEPTLIECTEKQIAQLEAISNSDTYNGGTNIYSTDIVPPYLETKYWKVR